MKSAIALFCLIFAACSAQQAQLQVVDFAQDREAGAQGDEGGADDASAKKSTIPEGTPVVGMRQMHVKVSWEEKVDWEKAKGTILYTTWNRGKTWSRSEKSLERRVLGGNESHVFTISVERDGLLGLYYINPADGKIAPPDENSNPKRYVYIDTTKPRAQSIFVVRTSNTSVRVAWSFTDEVPSDTGARISINGKQVLSEQPSVGEAEIGIEAGKVTVSAICADKAGNLSEASSATLP